MTINLNINSKLRPFVTKHKPIKIIIGGRGSGKSIAVCDIMTGLKMGAEGADILALREYQNSISDSIHQEMCKSVEERMMLPGWTIQEQRLRAPNKARTVYRGASRDPNTLKSMTGFKYAIFDEAQTASQDTLDKLIPTVIREVGKECWFIANPESSGDPFSQRFIIPFKKELDKHGYYEDDLHMILVLNWRDNPWWNEAQEMIRMHDFENMPRAKYDWIWEGDFNDSVDNAIIQPEWFDAAKDAHLDERFKAMFEPHGAIVAAHDPFDGGSDAAGFAVRHGSIITEVRSKSTGKIDEVCDWATGKAINANADWFVWDGDGMGTGLRGQVSTNFKGKHIKFHMFKGSLSGKAQDNAELPYMPTDGDSDTKTPKKYKDTFKNNRSQYYTELARRFHNTYKCVVGGKYIDPDDMISLNTAGIDDIVDLRSQLCRIPTKPNGNGLIQIMSKIDMKKLKIESPNEGDAVMMTLFMPPVDEEIVDINFDDWS